MESPTAPIALLASIPVAASTSSAFSTPDKLWGPKPGKFYVRTATAAFFKMVNGLL